MSNSNIYGGPVLNGAALWFNNPAFNQRKMGRPYATSVEDVSGALGGMQMYASNAGQSFGRMHTPFPPGFSPGIMPAAYNHNVWSGGHFRVPTGPNQQMLSQAHRFTSISNAGLAMAVNGNQQTLDLPDLGRRNSLSSNEEYGPRTPFFQAQSLGPAGKMVVPDNSPQTWTPPSIHHLGHSMNGSPRQLWRESNGYVVVDYDAICTATPIIPHPIPAIFSGDKSRGTLETSLENKNRTTNVYIRGLHPDTTDDMLNAYGSRFGLIESAKSMIDQHTGLCKGFGFIKYQSSKDGENCIRGFYNWGYEAKWARDSHNDKLKKLGDDHNTNLYISNLPVDLDFNEHGLMAIFGEHDCLSAKILRDTNGLSRGVGFARFASADVCREIIQRFNGEAVGSQGQPISIRFADTPRQKDLKAITQERRQYKTHEYNVAAFGPDSPYSHMGTLVAAAAAVNSPIPHSRSPLGTQSWIVPQSPYNLSFPGNTMSSIPITTSVATDSQAPDNTPLAERTGLRFRPYSVPLNAMKTGVTQVGEKKESEHVEETPCLAKRNSNIPAKVIVEQAAISNRQRENVSAHGSAVSSPIKATPVKQLKSFAHPKIAGTA